MNELYKRYRPKKLTELVGQPEVVNMLTRMTKSGKIPHAIVLDGPSGCGKTTIARILRRLLKCSEQDFVEMNSADFRGIDSVREIRQRMGLSPINGECRIYLIDEAHQLTTNAQDALLKMLEDTPKHVYFILATTDPGRLKKTIRTRCTSITVKALTAKHMKDLLTKVAESEQVDLSEDIVDAIIEVAQGSPRKALVTLNAALSVESDEERLELIKSPTTEAQAIEIARLLIAPGNNWSKISKLIKLVDEEPESIRWMVLSYASNVLLGNNAKLMKKAAAVIAAFRDNFYDSKRAGLALACYEVYYP